MTGRLTILGSGETAPTMVKVHRALLQGVEGPALLLDTPYGFQENADDISRRAQRYFAESVGRSVDVLSWREDALGRERALAALRTAGWIFAGPGSPTYALRQWAGTPLPSLIGDVVRRGGVVVFASAAALTLGSHTVPVYEIYKAGIDPVWAEGLDLVRALTGLSAVVIPHYDNAEGGHHDTRFCYLGERRLALLERTLPADAFVLGVDEHTGCLLDPAAATATVVGNGVVTVRRAGSSRVFEAGRTVSFAELLDRSSASAPAPVVVVETAPKPAPTSLLASADACEASFAAALSARDVEGCVAAVLGLEQALADWSADTLTSDEGEHARGLLRSMVVRLGELAIRGVRDPRSSAAPYVETLLALRASAREAKDFATSDAVRDALAAAGVEVRDTPSGVEWTLPDS